MTLSTGGGVWLWALAARFLIGALRAAGDYSLAAVCGIGAFVVTLLYIVSRRRSHASF